MNLNFSSDLLRLLLSQEIGTRPTMCNSVGFTFKIQVELSDCGKDEKNIRGPRCITTKTLLKNLVSFNRIVIYTMAYIVNSRVEAHLVWCYNLIAPAGLRPSIDPTLISRPPDVSMDWMSKNNPSEIMALSLN